jgi:hypothetical protein
MREVIEVYKESKGDSLSLFSLASYFLNCRHNHSFLRFFYFIREGDYVHLSPVSLYLGIVLFRKLLIALKDGNIEEVKAEIIA